MPRYRSRREMRAIHAKESEGLTMRPGILLVVFTVVIVLALGRNITLRTRREMAEVARIYRAAAGGGA